jgi:DNA-binding GntR family transcriptional regulator
MRHTSIAKSAAVIVHRTMNERVLHRIRELIVRGELPAGTQLDEQALANAMQISRTPIREAISKLNKEGLVEYRPYKGHFVRSFTAKEVSDLFEVRKALEGLAIRLAVAKLTDDDLTLLRRILGNIDTALAEGDLVAYSTADREFHTVVAQMSENASLIELLDRLGMQIQIMRTIANRDPHVVARTAHERPLILAALEQRDGALAMQLMEQHIEGVREALVGQLEAHEAQRPTPRGRRKAAGAAPVVTLPSALD